MNGERLVSRRLHMEDDGVGLERLLGSEVARNRRVSAQRHRDSGRGWAEESGQICGGVRNSPALAPDYQGDNLKMIVIGIFNKSEEIVYFLQL